MRRTRPLLVVGTLVLAAGIGTTVALTTRQAPTATAAAPAGQPATGPDAAAVGDPSTSPTPKTPDTSDRADGAKAVATARAFLARELGMTELVADPFRFTGARTGEVGFRHKFGEGRRPLPQTGPYAVVVRLQRLPAGWWVLGVQGRSIQITSPARLQRISSPLAVRGSAPNVYEGTLYFKVTQDRPGRDLLLGEGFVDGRSSTRPGDLGTLSFRQPAGTAPGWVIFYDANSDGSSNQIIEATVVRVQFAAATPAPRILKVTTSPTLRNIEGWLELPQGAGTVVVSVKATNAQHVRFTLTPTGTEVGDLTQLLGEDRTPADGFSLVWRYSNDPLLAHLGIQATGPGGTTEQTLYIVHP